MDYEALLDITLNDFDFFAITSAMFSTKTLRHEGLSGSFNVFGSGEVTASDGSLIQTNPMRILGI